MAASAVEKQRVKARRASAVVVVDERIAHVQRVRMRDARAPDGLVEDGSRGLRRTDDRGDDDAVEEGQEPQPLEERAAASNPSC